MEFDAQPEIPTCLRSNPTAKYPRFPSLIGEHPLLISKTVDGTAMVTNFRFCICEETVINIPLMMVGDLLVSEAAKRLRIGCKDGSTYSCTFATTEDCQACTSLLREKTGLPQSPRDLFAYRFYAVAMDKQGLGTNLTSLEEEHISLCQPVNPIFAYNFDKETERLQFDTSKQGAWRKSQANKNYEFCPTYPKFHILPAAVDDDRLKVSLDFRALKRFPSVVWRDKQTGMVLIRSSQPLSSFLGVSYFTNQADVSLIEEIVNACNRDWLAIAQKERRSRHSLQETEARKDCDGQEEVCSVSDCVKVNGAQEESELSESSSLSAGYSTVNGGFNGGDGYIAKKLAIVDCRSLAGVWGNSFKGGGTEDEAVYKCNTVHLDLANIHNVRDSFNKLRLLCHAYVEGTFLKSLSGCMWPSYISALLRGANIVMELMQVKKRPVLVHCSDGWDRTSQIVSLSELMMDSYYRTLEGFQVLVEREWLHFGHKFGERGGHDPKCSDTNQISPIFLQFLDCVYQLTLQYPARFQFNEAYLIKLLQHSYACLFGNFLHNCQRERDACQQKTASVWALLRPEKVQFVNSLYKPSDQVLEAKCSQHDIVLWKSVYMGSSLHVSQTHFHSESSPAAAGSRSDLATPDGMLRSKLSDDLSKVSISSGHQDIVQDQDLPPAAAAAASDLGISRVCNISSSTELSHCPGETPQADRRSGPPGAPEENFLESAGAGQDSGPDSAGALKEHCADSAGALKEHCPDSAGALKEHCPDSADALKEHCPDSAGALKERCPDSSGALEEHCPDSARALKEHCPDSAGALKEHCPESAGALKEHCPDSAGELKEKFPDSLDALENFPDSAGSMKGNFLDSVGTPGEGFPETSEMASPGVSFSIDTENQSEKIASTSCGSGSLGKTLPTHSISQNPLTATVSYNPGKEPQVSAELQLCLNSHGGVPLYGSGVGDNDDACSAVHCASHNLVAASECYQETDISRRWGGQTLYLRQVECGDQIESGDQIECDDQIECRNQIECCGMQTLCCDKQLTSINFNIDKTDPVEAGLASPDIFHVDNFEPGFVNPDNFEPGFVNPDNLEPGFVNPDNLEPGCVNPDNLEPGFVNPDNLEPGFVNPDNLEPGFVNPDNLEPGFVNPDNLEPGFVNPDNLEPGFVNPDNLEPGFVNSDNFKPGFMTTDSLKAGFMNPDSLKVELVTTDNLVAELGNPDTFQADLANPGKFEARDGNSNPDSIDSFTTEKVNSFTTEKVNSFTAEEVNSCITEKVNSFTTEKVNSFTTEKVNSFTTEKVNSFTTEEVNSFTTEKVNSFTTEEVNSNIDFNDNIEAENIDSKDYEQDSLKADIINSIKDNTDSCKAHSTNSNEDSIDGHEEETDSDIPDSFHTRNTDCSLDKADVFEVGKEEAENRKVDNPELAEDWNINTEISEAVKINPGILEAVNVNVEILEAGNINPEISEAVKINPEILEAVNVNIEILEAGNINPEIPETDLDTFEAMKLNPNILEAVNIDTEAESTDNDTENPQCLKVTKMNSNIDNLDSFEAEHTDINQHDSFDAEKCNSFEAEKCNSFDAEKCNSVEAGNMSGKISCAHILEAENTGIDEPDSLEAGITRGSISSAHSLEAENTGIDEPDSLEAGITRGSISSAHSLEAGNTGIDELDGSEAGITRGSISSAHSLEAGNTGIDELDGSEAGITRGSISSDHSLEAGNTGIEEPDSLEAGNTGIEEPDSLEAGIARGSIISDHSLEAGNTDTYEPDSLEVGNMYIHNHNSCGAGNTNCNTDKADSFQVGYTDSNTTCLENWEAESRDLASAEGIPAETFNGNFTNVTSFQTPVNSADIVVSSVVLSMLDLSLKISVNGSVTSGYNSEKMSLSSTSSPLSEETDRALFDVFEGIGTADENCLGDSCSSENSNLSHNDCENSEIKHNDCDNSEIGLSSSENSPVKYTNCDNSQFFVKSSDISSSSSTAAVDNIIPRESFQRPEDCQRPIMNSTDLFGSCNDSESGIHCGFEGTNCHNCDLFLLNSLDSVKSNGFTSSRTSAGKDVSLDILPDEEEGENLMSSSTSCYANPLEVTISYESLSPAIAHGSSLPLLSLHVSPKKRDNHPAEKSEDFYESDLLSRLSGIAVGASQGLNASTTCLCSRPKAGDRHHVSGSEVLPRRLLQASVATSTTDISESSIGQPSSYLLATPAVKHQPRIKKHIDVDGLTMFCDERQDLVAELLSEKDSKILDLERQLSQARQRCIHMLKRCSSQQPQAPLCDNFTADLNRSKWSTLGSMTDSASDASCETLDESVSTVLPWAMDVTVTQCAGCAAQFGMSRGKHHCCFCGKFVCTECSTVLTRVAEFSKPEQVHETPERVCQCCHSHFLQLSPGAASDGRIPTLATDS